MTVILAIDPGTEQSAWLVLDTVTAGLRSFAITPNGELVSMVADMSPDVGLVAVEQVESYGMPVGREVFETVRWAGRFEQAAQPCRVLLVPRRSVKLELCQDTRANDASIRRALMDRFGGDSAKGVKAAPGPLYGIAKDVWSALAVAVTAAAIIDREGQA